MQASNSQNCITVCSEAEVIKAIIASLRCEPMEECRGRVTELEWLPSFREQFLDSIAFPPFLSVGAISKVSDDQPSVTTYIRNISTRLF